MPHRQKPPLQPGSPLIAAEIARAAPACLRPMRRRGSERGQFADIVSEFHRPPPVTGLAGGVNNHGESAIQISAMR